MLDGDDAGSGATDEIEERLGDVVFQVKIVALGDGVQPDQLSSVEIHNLLDGVLV